MNNRQIFFNSSGFTLLETMIAMAIMLVAFASILMVQSASLNTSTKAKQMNIVAMLAKNKMIEIEYEIEGKTFEEVKKEDSGQFKEPFEAYQWKREIKEVKFPKLNFGGGGTKGDNEESSEGSSSSNTGTAERITKLFTQFLSDSIREVDLAIIWTRGKGQQEFHLNTYWVDLNHEFKLSE